MKISLHYLTDRKETIVNTLNVEPGDVVPRQGEQVVLDGKGFLVAKIIHNLDLGTVTMFIRAL